MTSSIPMFNGMLLPANSGYFTNCFTDVDGLLKKIKKNNSYLWKNVNEDDSNCINVKINHAKNNLYVKNIDLNDTDYYKSNKQTLYIVNSLKMAIQHCSKEYANKFNINIKFSNYINVYRQMPSSIFEETKVANDFYTVIMFLNEQPEMKKMQIQSQLGLAEITPVKSSLLILPPNTEYNLGHFYDLEQLYAITSFTKDDII